MHVVLTWVSRATGIGYRNFEPVSHEHIRGVLQVERESSVLARQVEQLERELRRRGELPHSN